LNTPKSDSKIIKAPNYFTINEIKPSFGCKNVQFFLSISVFPLRFYTKIFFNMPSQGIVDLSMAGDRLPFAGGGIAVDIMPGTVAVEHASSPQKLPD
jgi:hypothetical protein